MLNKKRWENRFPELHLQVEVPVQVFLFKEAVIVRIFFLLSVFSRGQINIEELWVPVKPAYLSSRGDRALGVDCCVCGTEKLLHLKHV